MMMKKLDAVVIWFALVLVWAICMVGSAQAGAPQDQIVMRWGTSHPIDDPLTDAGKLFAKMMAETTGGRVKVEIYPASQLGSQQAMAEQLQIGTLDLLNASAGIVEGFDPTRRAGLTELPYLSDSFEQIWHFMDSPTIREVFAPLRKNGIRFLYPAVFGLRHITNSVRPITKPEDIRGLKMRVPPSQMSRDIFVIGFGGSAIAIPWGETYMALQQRVADGQENPVQVIYSNRIYEVQKFLSLTGHQTNANHLWVSEANFNKWPPEVQQAVLNSSKKAMEYVLKTVEASEADLLKKMQAMPGFAVNDPDKAPFRKAAEAVFTAYGAKYGQIVKDIVNAAEKVRTDYPAKK